MQIDYDTLASRPRPKREAVENVFRQHPDWDYRKIAELAGCRDKYAWTVCAELRLRTVSIESAKETPSEETALVPVVDLQPVLSSMVPGLWPKRDYWAVQKSQTKAHESDSKVLAGAGLTPEWSDIKVLSCLNGVACQSRGLLNDLNNAQTQESWNERARAMQYFANFIECDVSPLARRGVFRGMPGEIFFSNLARHLRRRVVVGPLG